MLTPWVIAKVMAATWPAAQETAAGPFVLRQGLGGGKRVCAASLVETDFCGDDIARAQAGMRGLGQSPLFVIWSNQPADARVDDALELCGYQIVDPVVLYHAPIAALLSQGSGILGSDMSKTYPHWPPLALGAELWGSAGIGPARLAVMQRVQGPKTAILARRGDQGAGMCFAATCGDWAMLHALEVAAPQRRRGVGQSLLARAAHWAQTQGAAHLALAVTAANGPARGLYAKLGMAVAGHYHYRELLRE